MSYSLVSAVWTMRMAFAAIEFLLLKESVLWPKCQKADGKPCPWVRGVTSQNAFDYLDMVLGRLGKRDQPLNWHLTCSLLALFRARCHLFFGRISRPRSTLSMQTRSMCNAGHRCRLVRTLYMRSALIVHDERKLRSCQQIVPARDLRRALAAVQRSHISHPFATPTCFPPTTLASSSCSPTSPHR